MAIQSPAELAAVLETVVEMGKTVTRTAEGVVDLGVRIGTVESCLNIMDSRLVRIEKAMGLAKGKPTIA